ncbi:hypothetical protein PCASD_08173 [Puccinia coronata f. sp. avenae]|uniref:Uncharacterized protein n=1 Tax=Puccinia coronata f. sp. avenae TaxID=200324 RepID=A0A2N5VC52_9BASI|nr:hypothetical protein PCASD_08173 [Puccinia coronata f. sp. avenae]
MHGTLPAVALGLVIALVVASSNARVHHVGEEPYTYQVCLVQHPPHCQRDRPPKFGDLRNGQCCVCNGYFRYRYQRCPCCKEDNNRLENGRYYCEDHWANRPSRS